MDYAAVENLSKDLYIYALKTIPQDVHAAIERALSRETTASARSILETILRNMQVAADTTNLVCQDTGLPVYRVRIGSQCAVDGEQLRRSIIRGCERATSEHPLR